MLRPTIITLSTIPPRFPLLAPTLKSLLSQSLRAEEIRLYIPERYRRFPDWDGSLPELPKGINLHRFENDMGPASKILPAARDLSGRDVDILFCDDDNIYDRHWHKRIKQAAVKKPNTCIVEMGYTFLDMNDADRPLDRLPRGRFRKRDLKYRLQRLAYLHLKKPNITTTGYVDMLAGYGGVLVRPEWFDELAYDIPNIMWTVDDPWLSGNLERRGIPIWMTGKGYQLHDIGPGLVDSLTDFVSEEHDRSKANLLVVDYFRNNYGIWPKSEKVEINSPFGS